MMYKVPVTSEENWKEKYKVKKGEYLCDDCNQPQLITKEFDYLQPCIHCNCIAFWGM